MKFYLDKKQSIWTRTWFEADSIEEAKEMVRDGSYTETETNLNYLDLLTQ